MLFLMHFNENLKDECGTLVTGKATLSTTKKFGLNSARFTGGDFLSFNANILSGDFTIDFWVKRNLLGTVQSLFGQSDQYRLKTSKSVNIYFEAGNRVVFSITDGYLTESVIGAAINDTAWHHIAVCKDSSYMKVFVDGVRTSKAYSGSVNSSTSDFSIGRMGEYQGYYFNGYIDEFRILDGISVWDYNFSVPTTEYNYKVETTGTSIVNINNLDIRNNLALDTKRTSISNFEIDNSSHHAFVVQSKTSTVTPISNSYAGLDISVSVSAATTLTTTGELTKFEWTKLTNTTTEWS